jgi:hypothetical protein
MQAEAFFAIANVLIVIIWCVDSSLGGGYGLVPDGPR